MGELVFLTRSGCVNTSTMRTHLDAALTALGRPLTYEVVDVDALPATDQRGGYGTPTVLYRRRDIFGMLAPSAPHPPAT